MAILTKIHWVPMVGTVKDWRSFSGDPADTIRALGPTELAKRLGRENDEALARGDPPPHPKMVGVSTTMRVRVFDVDAGLVEVEVASDNYFHDLLQEEMSGDPEYVCLSHGCKHLKRGPDDPMPEVSLRMNL